MDRVTTVQPMLSSTPPLPACPGVGGLVLDEERNFYTLFYALIVRVAAEQDTHCHNELFVPGPFGLAV